MSWQTVRGVRRRCPRPEGIRQAHSLSTLSVQTLAEPIHSGARVFNGELAVALTSYALRTRRTATYGTASLTINATLNPRKRGPRRPRSHATIAPVRRTTLDRGKQIVLSAVRSSSLRAAIRQHTRVPLRSTRGARNGARPMPPAL